MTNKQQSNRDRLPPSHGEPNLKFVLNLHKITYATISRNFNVILRLLVFTVDIHTKITVERILAHQKGLSFDHLLFSSDIKKQEAKPACQLVKRYVFLLLFAFSIQIPFIFSLLLQTHTPPSPAPQKIHNDDDSKFIFAYYIHDVSRLFLFGTSQFTSNQTIQATFSWRLGCRNDWWWTPSTGE